jgi:hypothetical protein
MLIAAGILFVLALLFWFINKWFDYAGMNLMWVVRALILLSVVFIALNILPQKIVRLTRIDEPVQDFDKLIEGFDIRLDQCLNLGFDSLWQVRPGRYNFR